MSATGNTSAVDRSSAQSSSQRSGSASPPPPSPSPPPPPPPPSPPAEASRPLGDLGAPTRPSSPCHVSLGAPSASSSLPRAAPLRSHAPSARVLPSAAVSRCSRRRIPLVGVTHPSSIRHVAGWRSGSAAVGTATPQHERSSASRVNVRSSAAASTRALARCERNERARALSSAATPSRASAETDASNDASRALAASCHRRSALTLLASSATSHASHVSASFAALACASVHSAPAPRITRLSPMLPRRQCFRGTPTTTTATARLECR